jgi:DUF4097 and DUF4098 domain-containing protein YvlB
MKTRNDIRAVLTVAILCLAAGTALAGDTIDEKRSVDADARISLEILAGTLEIVGWDRNEVHIEGTLDPKAEKLEIKGGGSELEIVVKYPRRIRNINEGSQLTVHVPHGCRLEVQTISTEVTVAKVDGEVVVETVSGNVEVRDGPASLEISSVSGMVDVSVDTEEVEIETVSGRILVEGVKRELDVSTVSGETKINAGEIQEFSFNAVSGSLELRADPAANGRWEIDCHSGEIDLYVPADVDARFDIDSFSGDIDDDFGHKAKRTSKYAPGKELSFTQGGGSARIDISIFSGKVNIHKR